MSMTKAASVAMPTNPVESYGSPPVPFADASGPIADAYLEEPPELTKEHREFIREFSNHHVIVYHIVRLGRPATDDSKATSDKLVDVRLSRADARFRLKAWEAMDRRSEFKVVRARSIAEPRIAGGA